ncbi:ATP-binding protein [Schaalia sp. Marseille-Q2122]|uniref:ATP-binding protein n=1 Tax=Schaalia sp. Marseille-Q2122 TaxID=2736604 RepID=UPI00158A16FF|nr:SbcC/MukB-like Walker B domain-containing protein [Schaalia sp. Marseille-Q2122]
MNDFLWDIEPDVEKLCPGQWRLSFIQIQNWGTIDGLVRFKVPRKGLLLTGESGSGKSTILDAISAVLSHDSAAQYNAAASGGSGGDQARSRLSYVRGAVGRSVDDDTNEARTRFLRQGPVVSGIALTFTDGQGHAWTGIRVFFAPRGATQSGQLTSHFFGFDGEQDLNEVLLGIHEPQFVRSLKQAFPKAKHADSSSSFQTILAKKIGIESATAAALLHKTIAAKNVTSLDRLMREYMLDKPDTERSADLAVQQFQNLRAAHDDVVSAREQIELLAPLHELHKEYLQALHGREETNRLEDLLPKFRALLQADRALHAINEAEGDAVRLKASIQAQEEELNRRTGERDSLIGQRLAQGGAELTELETRIAYVAERIKTVEKARERFTACVAALNTSVPNNAEAYAEVIERVRSELTNIDDSRQGINADRDEKLRHLAPLEDDRTQVLAELRSLMGRATSVPRYLVDIRQDLADGLGIDSSAFPFVAELIDVTDERWRGAIERLLSSFAKTMLVRSEHADAVAKWVNGRRLMDHRGLGIRLEYQRISLGKSTVEGQLPEHSVIRKMRIAEHVFKPWLAQRLLNRFDYVCVDDVSELSRHDRAITIQGLIRDRSRHVKDDRYSITDRSRWILGTTNEARVEALREKKREIDDQIRSLNQEAEHLLQQLTDLNEAQTHLKQVTTFEWPELDLPSHRANHQRLMERKNQILAEGSSLVDLERQIASLDELIAQIRKQIQEYAGDYRSAQEKVERNGVVLSAAREELGDYKFADSDQEALDALCRRQRRSITSLDPQEAIDAGRQELRERREKFQRVISSSRERIITVQQRYKDQWSSYATNLVPEIEGINDFLERLSELEGHNLPRFEQRFRELLADQTQKEISVLAEEIRSYPNSVRERIRPVNASLSETPYDRSRGHFLSIQAMNNQSSTVKDFLADLKAITQNLVNVSHETTEQMEKRFLLIARVMGQLSSQEREWQNWRREVLDTRRHVRFRAYERDGQGQEVDVYEGSAGRSGGQSQKLVTFALAAALRYQLADPGSYVPRYGTVIVDEAFDKTDPQFTRDSLELFRSFGFQMLLASPLKMIQVVEPYIGGVVEAVRDGDDRTRLAAISIEEYHREGRR